MNLFSNQFDFFNFEDFKPAFEISLPPAFCPVCHYRIIIYGQKDGLTFLKCPRDRDHFEGATTLPLIKAKTVNDLQSEEKMTNQSVTQEDVLKVAGFLNRENINFEELFKK